MRHKTIILILSLLTLPFLKTFATAQIPDLLVYKGDTLSIFANPLELFPDIDSLRLRLFGNKAGCSSTACWREYQAEWLIENEQLYLIGIYSCCYYEDSLRSNLENLFPEKYFDGKVKADWVTGDILSPQGKRLYYVHMGYESLFETEVEFKFDKGILIGIKKYDNSKSKESVFSQNSQKLIEFIYSNINWSTLPKTDEKNIKVYLQFSANENGIIDSVDVMRGYSPPFDNEAIRVVKSIPEWDIYYRHGKHERRAWTLPIVFSKKNKRKYRNKAVQKMPNP